jgi:hypothetical protein
MSKYDNDLKDKIRSVSKMDEEYVKIKEKLLKGEEETNMTDFKIDQEGILKFKNIIYIPNSMDLKLLILMKSIKILIQAILDIKK